MTTHRTLDGNWEECLNPEHCALKFHLPELSPVQAAAIPFALLLPIFEAADPYDDLKDGGTVKVWRDEWQRDHRDYDLPAGVDENGTLYWYRHGQMHRDYDRPAMVLANGAQHWYRDGQQHRDSDKPALVVPGHKQAWYQYGRLHREHAPAVVHEDGTREWWEDNRVIEVQLPDGTRMSWSAYRASPHFHY